MATYIIEVSDANILVARAGEVILSSPGYALVDEDKVEVGETAFNQMRLYPRRAHNEFWHRLSTDALNNPTPYYRHHADLVYAHLKHIAEQLEDDAEVVFAVPGSYSKEQLSLLLGVAQESPLRAVGLVDVAAAVASLYPLRNPSFYLDISLHQGLISRLDVEQRVRRSAVTPIKGIGLARLYDRWVQLIADAFIEQCRFDPLHSAETEQALYRQLPQWLAAVREREEVLLEIASGNKRFEARLLQTQVIDRAQPFYTQLESALTEHSGGEPERLLINRRLAALPGIAQLFPDYRAVDELAFCRGCEQHLEMIRGEGNAINFITAFPSNGRVGEPAPAETVNQEAEDGPSTETHRQRPTHLLEGNYAYSLHQTLYIGLSAQGELVVDRNPTAIVTAVCSLQGLYDGVSLSCGEGEIGVTVNGAAVDNDCQLHHGDKLSIADVDARLTLISEV